MTSPSSKDNPSQGDTAFTEAVVNSTGSSANLRLKEVMPSLIRHLHGFAREVELTVEEWFIGVDFINRCGQMSNETRNETQLLSDVLGLESLVDEITSRQHANSVKPSLPFTPSTVLGPFYRHNAPVLSPSCSIISLAKRNEYLPSTAFLSGRVLNSSGAPIADATLDMWHTAPNGMYEQQDASQPDMDLRGRFKTDREGHYSVYCLRPVAYPIPDDGPVGQLLSSLGRHPYRPAHIHFIVSAPGFRALTTQIFDAEDKWLTDDAVFAVKKELIVRYEPREGDAHAKWSVTFDFVLVEERDTSVSRGGPTGSKE